MAKDTRYWLFDLDNTLYPPASGLFAAIDRRINRYLEKFYQVHIERADKVRKDYFNRYGLTLLGLMEERDADPDHYLDYVHRVPVADFLRPDRRLMDILESIPVPKAIFTNGSRRHSLAVTQALGVREAFEEIFDIASVGYVPKPDPRSYVKVLDRLGLQARETVLVEDLERNLLAAKDLGMVTVLVGRDTPSPATDYSLASLEGLPAVISDLHP